MENAKNYILIIAAVGKAKNDGHVWREYIYRKMQKKQKMQINTTDVAMEREVGVALQRIMNNLIFIR